MEQGFVPEAKDISTKAEMWFEGAPQKSWGSLRFKGLRHFEIQTWRCGRCGYLESYAPAV